MSEKLAQLSRQDRRRLLARLHERHQADETPRPAIPRHPGPGPHPLSFSQQRLWFLDQLEPGASAYNIPSAIRLTGPLDVPALARSVAEIVRRHEVLRTTFVESEGHPAQLVGPPPEPGIPVVDLTALPESARQSTVGRLSAEEARRPFDLARGPLLRMTLLRLGPAEHVALFTMHHIASDDWSIGLFVRELQTFYTGWATGRPVTLPELPIQYADFARWQRDKLQGDALAEKLAFWKSQLGGTLPVLELPADRPRPPVQTHRGAHTYLVLEPALARSLRALAREHGATLFMVLLAALDTLLLHASGQEDLLVGSPVSNRDQVETEGLIGFFVNTLVFRSDLSGDPVFTGLLGRVRETALAAYAHQELPFEKLVEELQPERDRSRPPLFQVVFVLQNAPGGAPTLELTGLSMAPVPFESGTARADLGLEVSDAGEALLCQLEYSTDLFDPASVQRLAAHFTTLLEGIAGGPGRRLSELPSLTAAERHQLLVEWTDSGPAVGGTVHEIFAERARQRPEDAAVVFQDTVLSYGELDRRSNALARRLLALGLKPEASVGLLSERSPEAVVGIFGILKAGGCYVPLDPDYPADRLEMMLLDAGVAAVVTQEKFSPALAPLERPVVFLDGAGEDGPIPSSAGPGSPVYIIYTSGSMGRPKGVVVSHGSLVNFSRAIAGMVGLGPGERMLEFATLAFDASALQIFPTLLSGAALVLDLNPGRLAPREIVALCERHGVTVLDLPAAVWRQWTEEMAGGEERILPRVGAFLTGGESLKAEHLRSWASLPARQARLFSSYGPTEATVTTTFFAIDSGEIGSFRRPKIPLGRPLPGTWIHLLDPQGQPVPIGVPGEIHIGGAGLARGYLGGPGLTAAAFRPSPFAAEPGERLYRTGDLARWLPDGDLEFLGRADHQVKIRGFRVELGEIEALLARHPGLRDAVVAAPEEAGGSRRLVAYVVPDPEQPPPNAELRAWLAQSLPDFMVPSIFVQLAALPLLPSGKVDRRALPAPEAVRAEADYVEPRDAVEKVIAEAFAQVLKVDRVGAFDNFFELGGHSLVATQAIARIRQAFEIDFQLRQLFEEPTVAGLAEALRLSPDGERVVRTAELRLMLAGLSDEEVEAMLLAEAGQEERVES